MTNITWKCSIFRFKYSLGLGYMFFSIWNIFLSKSAKIYKTPHLKQESRTSGHDVIRQVSKFHLLVCCI